MSSRYTEVELEVLNELGIYDKKYENFRLYWYHSALYLVSEHVRPLNHCGRAKLEKCMNILINLCDNHDDLWESDRNVIVRLEDFEGGLCHTERTLRRTMECINFTKSPPWMLWPVIFNDYHRSRRKNTVKLLLECVEFSRSDLRASLCAHKRVIEQTFYVDMIIEVF